MRIDLSEFENKLLESINIVVDKHKNYSEDEIEDILDIIYFNESANVGSNERLAKQLANIADKIADLM